MSIAERIMSRVTVEASGCWAWTGAYHKNPNGRHTPMLGKRAARPQVFKEFVGDNYNVFVPTVMCGRWDCVSPDCMILDDAAVATKSAQHGASLRREQKVRDGEFCRKGHLWARHGVATPAGSRVCRECARLRVAARRAKAAPPARAGDDF